MSIRLKVLLILGTTLSILIMVIYMISNFIIGNNIKKQEVQLTRERVNNVLKVLSLEYASLNDTSGDWAQWDETYDFVKTNTPEYLVNLDDSTFSNLKLNVMAFIDVHGKIIFGKGYDVERNEEIDFPEDFKEYVEGRRETFKHATVNSIISGIILLEKGPLMFSSRPVTTTDTTAPIEGAIIMGRYLNAKKISNFEELTDAYISFERLDQIEPDSYFGEILPQLRNSANIFVKPLNKDIVAGYTKIDDVHKDAKLVLEVATRREIYKQGESNLKLLLIVLTISSLIIFVVCNIMIQKLITSRLEYLNLFIKETGSSKNTSGYIELKGSDEISDLARATNTMLSEIDKVYRELKENEERLTLVLEGSNDGFWDWNIVTGNVYFSPNCFELVGYKPNEIEVDVEKCKQLIHPDDLENVILELDKSIQYLSEFYYVEYRVLTKGHDWRWMLTRGKVVEMDSSGKPVRMAGTISDISDRKRSEEEIKFLSFNDKLTGLNNRAYFEREFEKLNDSNQVPFAIIMGDVNGLKIANDAFGHEEGDKLLCKVAEALRKSCRNGDVISRWGGDEFAIILYDSDEAASINACDRIKENCSRIDGCVVKPSIALGLAVKSDIRQKGEQLLKDAEERMYRNKLLENKSVRSSIISSLKQTLAEKSHETEEHTKRMREMCVKMGHAIGLKNEELDQLVLLATLHDIGKIAIPDNILLKPGKLDEEEWKIMKSHTEIGYRIAMSSPELMHIAKSILSHHERYDGTGYPNELKGDEIPLIARILAIVDSFDVMTHVRPYKIGISREEAIVELKRCAGSQFDPELVRIFLEIEDLLIVY